MHSLPLCCDASGSRGDIFNKETYRYYQTSGTKLDYIVWPALQLHKDGPLLSKGVAEAMTQKSIQTTKPCTETNKNLNTAIEPHNDED